MAPARFLVSCSIALMASACVTLRGRSLWDSIHCAMIFPFGRYLRTSSRSWYGLMAVPPSPSSPRFSSLGSYLG